MKIAIKSICLLLASAMALASCSQEDTPALPTGDSQIVFRTSMPELTSRADVLLAGDMLNFYVTAFDFDDPTALDGSVKRTLFHNEKVAFASGKGVYTSSACCWPDPGKESDEITIFGFYPGLPDLPGAGLQNKSTASALDYKLTGFRVVKDIADQVDFVTAYTHGNMADDQFSGVTLPFAHQLSRIEIKACGANKSCDIEIAGVRIGGVGVENTFDFRPIDGGGVWSGDPKRGIVEYVYREGDKIFTCGKSHKVGKSDAVSIMGKKLVDSNGEEYENNAMVLPAKYAQWDNEYDGRNADNKLYFSVLLRVIDATPTAGENPKEKQRFPYKDLAQGADALSIEPVYMAVDKTTGAVYARLYKKDDGGYRTDTEPDYQLPANAEVKEFGWAALPIEADWAPGYIYTYTLDYTLGVGLLDPEVETAFPHAGDPVISDKVGFSYTVKEWKVADGYEDEFVVPGS